MCLEGRKKETGQKETKICLHLPKKEMELRPDSKVGNKTRGQGQQENQRRNHEEHESDMRLQKKKNMSFIMKRRA